MFDLSLAETSLTLLVALLLIGPEELPSVIRTFRNLSRKARTYYKEFSSKFLEIEELDELKQEANKLNADIRKIVDLDGNLQETYDVSDIMPEIEKAKKEREGKLRDKG